MANIYLFSKTLSLHVEHVDILDTTFYDKAIDFDKYDAIVITSKQAILALEKISPRWREKKILSIAKMSEQLVEKYGATLLESGDGYGDSLLDIITNNYSNLRWLYPRPEVVASDFYKNIKDNGIRMQDIIVYKTSCNDKASKLVLHKEDILIFTSPFTIECFEKYYTFFDKQKVVAIGSTTAKALPSTVELHLADETSVDSCVTRAKKLLTYP